LAENLKIDFQSSAFEKKLKSAHLGSQPLKKAALLRGKPCRLIDGTAGFAEDSFLLAEWGFEVMSFERNHEVGLQIKNAIAKLGNEDRAFELLESGKIKFYFEDFYTFCKREHLHCEVLYLDPMFPVSNKSALSEKKVVELRKLVGEELEPLEKILKKGLEIATSKVLLKRPLSAPVEFQAQHVFKGSSVRYEVYLKNVALKKI